MFYYLDSVLDKFEHRNNIQREYVLYIYIYLVALFILCMLFYKFSFYNVITFYNNFAIVLNVLKNPY